MPDAAADSNCVAEHSACAEQLRSLLSVGAAVSYSVPVH